MMKNLQDEKTLVILAYADAGLGHLRVTNALYEGLPEGISPILLRSKEGAIRSLHRFTSTSPILRFLLLWTQKGKQEDLITRMYIKMLHKSSEDIMVKLEDIVEQQMHIAQQVVVVCTHFGLAHQLGHIKSRFEKKWKIKMLLAVCVTDDSPQPIWYVPEADMIAVPSKHTKQTLERYRKRKKLNHARLEVLPYPVSPVLGHKFTTEEFNQKKNQLDPEKSDLINVSIPVSGAAVGLDYLDSLVKLLHKNNDRFVFNVISLDNLMTKAFLVGNNRRSYVTTLFSAHSRKVVRLYDKMFLNSILSLEITKPSEQAFKALFSTKQRGGIILLLTEPVGEQEYDNLDYLRRNKLIPSLEEQEKLYTYCNENVQFSDAARKSLIEKAKQWRGMRIPDKPTEAARFIEWCLQQGIFKGMMNSTKQHSDGVTKFWKLVDKKLKVNV